VFLRHDGLRSRLGLTQHRDGPRDAFDETRTGLDHLAFGLSSREELDSWARRFTELGVSFSPPAEANSIPGAVVLVFRDPDEIQLELFFDPSPGSVMVRLRFGSSVRSDGVLGTMVLCEAVTIPWTLVPTNAHAPHRDAQKTPMRRRTAQRVDDSTRLQHSRMTPRAVSAHRT
jgi:hypothetical protein